MHRGGASFNYMFLIMVWIFMCFPYFLRQFVRNHVLPPDFRCHPALPAHSTSTWISAYPDLCSCGGFLPPALPLLFCILFHYKNSSFSFLTEQAFLIAIAAMDTIAPLTFLALWGHCFTQRIQAMHFLESAVNFTGTIACTGQFFAQTPHFTQSLDGFGTSPAPPAFL